MREFLRSGRWLSLDMIAGRARVLLVINLILVGWAMWTMHRPPAGEPPVNVDFVSFYAAGSLARSGTPVLAYDRTAHAQAEAAAAGPSRNYLYFFYPPPYLMLCSLLALLPYGGAFAVFELMTLLMFLLVARATAGPVARAPGGWRHWLLPVLAFTPLFWSAGEGQNAFLTASLLGGALLVLDERPVLAGLLVALLCYKPHFGLLIPVALASGGRWRAFGAAGVGVAAAVGSSWWLYGTATWQAYLASFLHSGDAYASGEVSFVGMVNLYGAARLVGLTAPAAVAIQAVASVLAAAMLAWIWRAQASRAVRSAALLAATMVALPLVLIYDQMVMLPALIWLAREGRSVGFLPWEKTLLAAAFLLPMVGFPLVALGLPIAPLPALILLGLCARRTAGVHGRASSLLPALASG